MTTTPEQIEAVARIIAYETGYTWGSSALDHDALREAAIAVIAFMRPFIRAEALEEAADVVGEVGDCAEAGAYITAIRALKEKP
jgi:hypothetical protein